MNLILILTRLWCPHDCASCRFPGVVLIFSLSLVSLLSALCGTLTFNFYALMFSHGLRHSSQELTRTSDTCFRLLLATAGAKVRRPYLYLLPAPLLITHHSSHRYQHSTPLPHSCVLRCRVECLASCPKAAWVCCLRHVCTLPAPVHPASVLPAPCCLLSACALRAACASRWLGPGGSRQQHPPA